MKVCRILGMFSRIRPSLTLEAENRLYKAIVLPVLVIVILCAMNVDKKTATRLNDYKDEQRGSSSSKLPQNYQLIKL